MTATIDLFRHADDVQHVAAGEVISTEGEPGDGMYVVIEGEAEIMYGGRVLATAGPGEMRGEMALIDTSARGATARVRTDCKMAPSTKRHMTFLVQQTPHVALTVKRIMAERPRRMNAANG